LTLNPAAALVLDGLSEPARQGAAAHYGCIAGAAFS
jgi:hypothetical protein